MNWMDQVSGLMQQYNGAQATQAPQTVNDDFDTFSQAAPQTAIADGLSAAFRSEQTPAFGNMVGQLFNQSNGQQRASILNTLLAVAGPMILQKIMSRGAGAGNTGASGSSGAGGGLGSLIDLIGGATSNTGGGVPQITPEQAEQISPEAVADIAQEAEKKDPSVIDQISNVYSQHPDLIKTLGAAALTVALASIASRQARS